MGAASGAHPHSHGQILPSGPRLRHTCAPQLRASVEWKLIGPVHTDMPWHLFCGVTEIEKNLPGPLSLMCHLPLARWAAPRSWPIPRSLVFLLPNASAPAITVVGTSWLGLV